MSKTIPLSTRELRDALRQTARDMRQLADKLSTSDGQPLDPSEKTLLRTALLPRFDESMQELRSTFLAGEQSRARQIVENMFRYFSI